MNYFVNKELGRRSSAGEQLIRNEQAIGSIPIVGLSFEKFLIINHDTNGEIRGNNGRQEELGKNAA